MPLFADRRGPEKSRATETRDNHGGTVIDATRELAMNLSLCGVTIGGGVIADGMPAKPASGNTSITHYDTLRIDSGAT